MSVTAISSYEDLLYQLQSYKDEKGVSYPRSVELIFEDSQVYDVDLNSRLVNTPDFLSVQFDHNAEILYFKCPRFYENVDLASTVCVIEYLNAEHTKGQAKTRDSGIFWVPYVDVSHYDVSYDENGEKVITPMMYIPWAVGGLATLYPGQVTFTIRFFNLVKNSKGYSYAFNLSTRPKNGEILHGIDLDEDELSEFSASVDVVSQIYAAIAESEAKAFEKAEAAVLYWKDV